MTRLIIRIHLYKLKKFYSVNTDVINKLNSLKEFGINYSFVCTNINDIDKLTFFEIDNNNIKYLKLYLFNLEDNGSSFDLKRKFHERFPNLTNIEIIIKNKFFYHGIILNFCEFNLEENSNSKIKNIKIEKFDDYINGIKLYCQSFETLESIDLNFESDGILSIFNGLNVLFKSLYKFHFSSHFLPSKDSLTTIYNIIDNMPNLRDFKLEFGKWVNKKENHTNEVLAFKEIYENLIKKILSFKSIKIINISLFMEPDFYSKSELLSLFPTVNYSNFYQVNIEKINQKNKLCSKM